MSIATEITRLTTAKSNIKTAIEAKGVSVPSNALISTYDTYIGQIQGGGGGDTSDHTVFLYDYDGELLYSYTKADFLALEAYPANPTHTGLTAQGWNWTLAEAKAYVTKYDYLVIGQNYVTTDGNTKVYISLKDSAYLDFDVSISKCTKVGAQIGLDWGDGSVIEYFNINVANADRCLSHTYATTGDYVIQIIPEEGDNVTTFGIGSSGSYASLCDYYFGNLRQEMLLSVTRVEFGRNVVFCSLFGSYNLETFTTPRSLTQMNCSPLMIASGTARSKLKAFISSQNAEAINIELNECQGLKCISLAPTNMTLSSQKANFQGTSVEYLTFPEGWTYPNNVNFSSCRILKAVIISDSATSIYSFSGDKYLRKVVLPQSLTTIGNNCFEWCPCLEEITIPNTVTSLGTSVFSNSSNLKRVTLPNTITSLPNGTFNACYSLESVTIPATVTSIGSNAFKYCTSLITITIPSGVTTIGNDAIRYCLGLESITVLATVPPTWGNGNSIESLLKNKTNFKIYVPSGSGSAYKTATNWSSFADCIEELS